MAIVINCIKRDTLRPNNACDILPPSVSVKNKNNMVLKLKKNVRKENYIIKRIYIYNLLPIGNKFNAFIKIPIYPASAKGCNDILISLISLLINVLSTNK